MIKEDSVIASIEEDLRLQKEADRLNIDSLGTEWGRKMLTEPGRFIKQDFKLKAQAVRNFRKNRIFVLDIPVGRQSALNLLNIVDGARRGHARMLRELLKVIEDAHYTDLLKKYPCSKVGNPNAFSCKGYRFTLEWLRHIYFLGLFKKYLEKELKEDFAALDLGCFYGVFSSLLKKEFKKSHHLLVDLPQQLALARYYLGLEFPDASIATYKDIVSLNTIDLDFIKKYDFILVPCYFYNKIAKRSIDVFTNFMSLQEMSRDFFDYYTKQEPFLSAQFLLTVNRFQSAPTYDNGLTILDYPLGDFERLHFATTPIVGERYKRTKLFFYTYFPYPSQHFEFIGKRQIEK